MRTVFPFTMRASIGQRLLHISQIERMNLSSPFSAISPNAPKLPGIKTVADAPVVTTFKKSLRAWKYAILYPFLVYESSCSFARNLLLLFYDNLTLKRDNGAWFTKEIAL